MPSKVEKAVSERVKEAEAVADRIEGAIVEIRRLHADKKAIGTKIDSSAEVVFAGIKDLAPDMMDATRTIVVGRLRVKFGEDDPKKDVLTETEKKVFTACIGAHNPKLPGGIVDVASYDTWGGSIKERGFRKCYEAIRKGLWVKEADELNTLLKKDTDGPTTTMLAAKRQFVVAFALQAKEDFAKGLVLAEAAAIEAEAKARAEAAPEMQEAEAEAVRTIAEAEAKAKAVKEKAVAEARRNLAELEAATV